MDFINIELLNISISNKIKFDDINYFYNVSSKSENDESNKVRENIISSIINNEIPKEYFQDIRWSNLKLELENYIRNHFGGFYEKIECKQKGGRKFNHDFTFRFFKENQVVEERNIEFKYNAMNIDETPQWVSPHNPSQYLNINFEEWYYDNVLPKIVGLTSMEIPDKSIYLKQINSPNPECMMEFKKLYKESKAFSDNCKKIDRDGIRNYISIAELNTEKLSDYFVKSQKDKHYLLYKNKKFYYDKMNIDNMRIKKDFIVKKAPNFICKMKSGQKIEIRLRWKNGNGIAYPAFQIKRKYPLKKELIRICNENSLSIGTQQINIKKMKVKEIRNLLSTAKIIF
jgi:hypothetical protein